MFACIYFAKDASLTVVSKNDNNLLVGNFESVHEVEEKKYLSRDDR